MPGSGCRAGLSNTVLPSLLNCPQRKWRNGITLRDNASRNDTFGLCQAEAF